MRKRPYGVSIAWLIVVLLVPFLGGFFYLLFGENRIPERRIERAKASFNYYQHWLKNLRKRSSSTWITADDHLLSIHQQAETLIGIPVMKGNKLSLYTKPEDIINSINEGINNATSTCHLQFYIWEEGGSVDTIIAALMAAAKRGVTCRILLDAIGSRDFLKSNTVTRMEKVGIKIQPALPAGILKAIFSRIDIRNHRKIVVIDGTIAFTGSQNMVDPDVFKKDAGVGNWIDIMVKIEGPVVESLAGTFLSDWFLETSIGQFNSESLLQDYDMVRAVGDIHPCNERGDSAVQLVPSGPGFVPEAIHSLLLTTIYTARRELIMTTPYFIPDEPLLAALKAAAWRGVAVKIIVPKDNDSMLVQFASRARYEELARAGIKIFHFSGGLLHSKTITVDRKLSLFGSVNLDMRSFWLNFEATLFIYCKNFTKELYTIQNSYLEQSKELDIKHFTNRSWLEKFKENVVLLISPLL